MWWSLQHFVSREDVGNLEKWKYKVVDNSISTEYLTPFWNYAVLFLPIWLAPNVVTLLGLCCTICVFSLCVVYESSGPLSLVVVFFLFLYQTLDALDGKHARQLRNGSPIGELMDHAADNISTIFCAYQLGPLIGMESMSDLWLTIQTSMIVFLHEHAGM